MHRCKKKLPILLRNILYLTEKLGEVPNFASFYRPEIKFKPHCNNIKVSKAVYRSFSLIVPLPQANAPWYINKRQSFAKCLCLFVTEAIVTRQFRSCMFSYVMLKHTLKHTIKTYV